MSNEKKYVCPMDLFGGIIRKGDLYHSKGSKLFMHPVKQNTYETGVFAVPYEIAITWEEYQEPKRLRIVDLTDKEVIHCETEEEANRILKLVSLLGFYCNNSVYDVYMSSTCYNVKIGAYANFDFYKKMGFTIHKSTDFPDDINQPEIKELEKGAIRYSIGGIYERFDGEKWTSNFNTEITDADLVVGKTVLIEKFTKNERLVIGKTYQDDGDVYIHTDGGEYDLKLLNGTYTIKNQE